MAYWCMTFAIYSYCEGGLVDKHFCQPLKPDMQSRMTDTEETAICSSVSSYDHPL